MTWPMMPWKRRLCTVSASLSLFILVSTPCWALPRTVGIVGLRGGGLFKRFKRQEKAPEKVWTFRRISAVADQLTHFFPLWVMFFAMLGIFQPKTVTWLNGDLITLSVSLVMIFTGMTLEPRDFAKILSQPVQVALGCLCQFTIMPLVATMLGHLLHLPGDIAAGLILLGCCPGGTSSNLITLIAGGDVALSVLMTSVSTILAPVATSLLVAFLAGKDVDIDKKGMFLSVINVVLGPVFAGLVLNRVFPKVTKIATSATPLISVILVSMICGSVMGTTKGAIREAGVSVALAVVLLHCLGFLSGWSAPKLFGFNERVARTTAIETGIQSSALAVLLASKHFPNPKQSAIAGAISAPVQSVLGSLLASYWHRSSHRV